MLKPIAFKTVYSGSSEPRVLIEIIIAGSTILNDLKFDISNLKFIDGEFDPGSERTLAAWIRHASRARLTFFNSSEKKLVMRAANG